MSNLDKNSQEYARKNFNVFILQQYKVYTYAVKMPCAKTRTAEHQQFFSKILYVLFFQNQLIHLKIHIKKQFIGSS